ncbi:MAG: hypothetical protein P8P24_08390, partial [Planktomarina sp.]|nr:hypothetical protein [Planktomarina sp.]
KVLVNEPNRPHISSDTNISNNVTQKKTNYATSHAQCDCFDIGCLRPNRSLYDPPFAPLSLSASGKGGFKVPS